MSGILERLRKQPPAKTMEEMEAEFTQINGDYVDGLLSAEKYTAATKRYRQQWQKDMNPNLNPVHSGGRLIKILYDLFVGL